MDKRTFLKATALCGIGILKGANSSFAMESRGKNYPSYAMIIDVKRCMDCKACMVACKLSHLLPPSFFITVVRELSTMHLGSNECGFIPLLCNHCESPPCQKACPNGAIKKLPNGIVLVDPNLCDGLGLCVKACPFQMINLASNYSALPLKCDFCTERLALGLKPRCVEICPSGARLFGNLSKPEGEFKEYLNKKSLFGLGKRFALNTRVFYAGIE